MRRKDENMVHGYKLHRISGLCLSFLEDCLFYVADVNGMPANLQSARIRVT